MKKYHPPNKPKLNLSYFNNIINLNIPIQIVENKIYKYNDYYDYYYQRIIHNIMQLY